MHGRFKCPPDTIAQFAGKSISFNKVSDSIDDSVNFEMVLFEDQWKWLPRLTLRSNSVSEKMNIYLSHIPDNNVQTEFLGKNNLVGIYKSSENKSTTYTAVIESFNNDPISEKFDIGLNKSGEIIRLNSDVYCYGLNTEYRKYFKTRCSMSVSRDPLYVTFYEDNMAADNIELYNLTYILKPDPCGYHCIASINKWFFKVV
ncbi:uncharacterized protein LOC134254363 [Saccostrea cucullata]|uniref:uncharacterized protein LOC134254363 n=1 Tax=Saccostrea cuccullata TaxID=36930 RepID=UPI002ED25433